MIRKFVCSPTAMAVNALGIPLPDLPAATASCACGLCGSWLEKDQTSAKVYQPATDFGAGDQLHPNRAALICQACAAAVTSTSGLLSRHSRALFTPNAAYRLSSAEDIGWMLTQAEPPFVAVFNTRAAAHVIWQAPVTHDLTRIGIVLGQIVGGIRPDAVFGAREALKRLASTANEALQSHYQWPVLNLSLYDDAVDVCRMIPSHERILRQSAGAGIQEDLNLFDDLNLPERWALAALLLARPKRNQAIDDFQKPPSLAPTNKDS